MSQLDLFLPEHWPANSDWTPWVSGFFHSEAGQRLAQFVQHRREEARVFPGEEDVFNAFRQTSFAETKVAILGQDPYHGEGQAHGLSFSVLDGVPLPPSLRNIYGELIEEFEIEKPVSGNLTTWAQQGVLLLNTVLTVDESQAGSHRKQGWETFTDLVISAVNQHPKNCVFVLWGKPAEKKAKLIDERHHLHISAHPSPLSAHRGFKGSRPFSKINEALVAFGRDPINWTSVS